MGINNVYFIDYSQVLVLPPCLFTSSSGYFNGITRCCFD